MRAAITITMMMTETTPLLNLLAWLSPAFPTGGFAYSHGIEWAVEAGDISDADSLRTWLEDLLLHGSLCTDAILFRHAHAGADVTTLAIAVQASQERLAESVGQGNAFIAAAAPWQPTPPTENADVPYAVAVARMAGGHGIDADLACAGFLQAAVANLISAAVRTVPLGQSAGIAVLAALQPIVLQVAAATRGATLDDIGGCAFRSDIASMRHETQYTRLFRS